MLLVLLAGLSSGPFGADQATGAQGTLNAEVVHVPGDKQREAILRKKMLPRARKIGNAAFFRLDGGVYRPSDLDHNDSPVFFSRVPKQIERITVPGADIFRTARPHTFLIQRVDTNYVGEHTVPGHPKNAMYYTGPFGLGVLFAALLVGGLRITWRDHWPKGRIRCIVVFVLVTLGIALALLGLWDDVVMDVYYMGPVGAGIMLAMLVFIGLGRWLHSNSRRTMAARTVLSLVVLATTTSTLLWLSADALKKKTQSRKLDTNVSYGRPVLVVDNATANPLWVSVGYAWDIKLPARSHCRFSISSGIHDIHILDAGTNQTIARERIRLVGGEAAGEYVYNIAAANAYTLETQFYE